MKVESFIRSLTVRTKKVVIVSTVNFDYIVLCQIRASKQPETKPSVYSFQSEEAMPLHVFPAQVFVTLLNQSD